MLFIAALFRYMVDAADKEKINAAKEELHGLLAKPQLSGTPLLVLGNKCDLPEAFATEQLIEQLYVAFPSFDRILDIADSV